LPWCGTALARLSMAAATAEPRWVLKQPVSRGDGFDWTSAGDSAAAFTLFSRRLDQLTSVAFHLSCLPRI
jgi:hypothetical protein